MEDSEWRSKLDMARARVASNIQDEFAAMIEAQVLYAIRAADQDDNSVCRSFLDDLNRAYSQLLTDPQAETGTLDNVAFGVLVAEVRGEKWNDPGLEKARSECDAARASMAGLNLEFLIRAWLDWRLKTVQGAH